MLSVLVKGWLCLLLVTSVLAAPKVHSVASFGSFIIFDPSICELSE